mmetsp:Transcript_8136/g.9003  ORF Transcript_8136/g.9003 Transcript_8136/m.9003 type:complete len:425 (-) Transcript_8136:45-1319(-)
MTDDNPDDYFLNNNMTDDNKGLLEKFACQDPFFEDVLWPAVPRSMIINLLKSCAKYDIKATLDIHTYPGGTSPGTFSGVWPRWPRFWTHGDASSEKDIGRQLWKNIVHWLESLDDDILQGLQGITPMNEPGHLAGIFANGKIVNGNIIQKPYLPPLLPDTAQSYLNKLSSNNNKHTTKIPDGPHLRVLKWLDDAVDVFRESSLQKKGIHLIMNVHESLFEPTLFSDSEYKEDYNPQTYLIAAWWSRITTAAERRTWAVLDIHHYHAWSPQCMGATTNNNDNNTVIASYRCNNITERTDTLTKCFKWANSLRTAIIEECVDGTNALLMSGEMSASTHHSVKVSCLDTDTLKSSYKGQLNAARQANIDLYWWSYTMPYGDLFRSAWSFKHFLYRMGITTNNTSSNNNGSSIITTTIIDDEPQYPCQ